jgi:ABC-type transport system involved in multi-copper enzyme maturation permease subunit
MIERELRVALRKQRPAQGRLKVAALAVGGSVLFLLLGALTGDRGVGRTLEQFLCLAGLWSVLRAPMLTAGVLAEERRNQTLGLLFLSGLGPGEVFASKFLSSALIAFTNLLAIFPMLALPFLIGGVSYELFIAIICALPVLMLFALSVSLLASVLSLEDSAAVVLANVLGAVLCLLGPAIYLAHIHFSPSTRLSFWWLRSSPAYGPALVWQGFSSGFHPGEQREFWINIVLTLGWSALALAAAAFALKRVWRERETEGAAAGWLKRWRGFMQGSGESRRRLGRAWLNINPFVWLAGRNRQPAMLGWLVIGGIVLVWLLCWAVWLGRWTGVTNFVITAALLNLVLTWLTRHAAAQETGQLRRDGAYELLLTTPLTPGDIVHGALESLRWHFRPLAKFVLWLNVLMMLAGLVIREWNTRALVVYFCLWLFLLTWNWRLSQYWARVLPVMWVSLNCGRPAYAAWRASTSGSGQPGTRWWYWIWVWNISNCRPWRGGFQQFPTGSGFEFVFALIVLFFWLLWFVMRLITNRGKRHSYEWDSEAKAWCLMQSSKSEGVDRACEKRLISEFREIVREPLPEANDPRFKKWNVRERFPQGWGTVQQQLHERLARKLTEPY